MASRVRAAAHALFVLALVGVALAYGSAFLGPQAADGGAVLLAVAMPVSLLALAVLGAWRDDRPSWLFLAAVSVAGVAVAGALLAAWRLPADAATDRLWLGLPRRAALLVYGVCGVPLVLLPLAYAATFPKTALTDADVARVRAAARSREP
jgi:ABC-type Na+ efflux pump permease subunit